MATYVLAIDQGTTGSTALLLDMANNANVIARANVEFKQHYPKAGWVEHDLDDIWRSVTDSMGRVLQDAQSKAAAFKPSDIASIGITNQRETLCIYERGSGAAARKAIVWQCRRSSDVCRILREEGQEAMVRSRTGLVLDPYFTGSKIRWVMENEPDLARRATNGELLFSTIESFLLYRLTGGKSFATEASNASRTLLMDIERGTYADDLLQVFKVPSASMLPEIKDSAGHFGVTKGVGILPDGIPIAGIVGDQQAALAGQSCFTKGEAKCTYGTGAFLLMNTGTENLRSTSGLLTTVAWQLNGKITYCFEGASFIAGAAVQFLRDQLGFISKASETEHLASETSAAPDLYFVPALTGLGAPYWNAEARGAFFGLTRGSTRQQLIRAALEAIAFQVTDLLSAMDKDAPGVLKVLRVDGGACENNLLMQMQANLARVQVDRPQNLETTALGAGMFAALGSGIVGSLADLERMRLKDRSFLPESSFDGQREAYLQGWKRAVRATEVFSGK